MNYVEALLHQYGFQGLDGGTRVWLFKGLGHLSSVPFFKLFKASPLLESESKGAEMAEKLWFYNSEDSQREEWF
ncbi:hypothetical protein Hanom_Chr16g01460711 [Helianthus anomalus]